MSLYTNLSYSLLCPFQLLLDLAFQTDKKAYLDVSRLAFTPFGELNSPNEWINLESLGNIVPIRAQQLIKYLSPYLSKTLCIHIYLDERRLSSDNLYSLLLLAEELPQLTLFFYIAEDENPCREQLTQLFTAKNSVDIHFAKSNTIQAFHQAQLKELRPHQQAVLASKGFKFDSALNINLLIGYAWTLLKTGAYEIGTHLLEEARSSCENIKDADMLLLHLQLIRFHSHQYEKLALEPYPPFFSGVDADSTKYLYYLKAYAATLTRHLDIAEIYFEKAGINEHLPLADEFSLYQLNIFALYSVFQQKADLAYRLEKKIEQFAQDHQLDSIGLKYVNFINIARLHKKAHEYPLSLSYYEKAYKIISQGGYTTSDHIYYNMNLGSLHEAAEDFKAALLFWINAALHWLVAENPYALAWRPKLILCQEKTTELNHPLLLSDVVRFFHHKIDNLLDKAGIPEPKATEQHFHFCLNHPALLKEACYVHNGLILYSSYQITPPVFEELKPLADYLSSLLKHILNFNSDYRTLVIDDSVQNLYQIDKQQARILASVNHCQRCYWNGESLTLQKITSNELQSGLTLSLSELIEDAEKEEHLLKLKYKRSFLNKTLDDEDEINIFLALKEGDHSKASQQLLSNLPLLQRLLYKKIICLQINPEK